MSSNNKKIDYKTEILETLNNYASGLTITDLAKKIEYNRNTVSKYLTVLEAEGKVYKKNIGTASIYTTSKRINVNRRIVATFVKSLLYGIKVEFPNKEQKFKDVGRRILEQFEFPIGNSYIKEIEKVKKNGNTRAQMEIFREFYNSFDFLQDDVEILPVELSNNKAVYRYKNSEFFENSDDYIYYYHIVCGIAEGLFLQYFNQNAKCNVANFVISKNKEESYVDISIEIV